LTHDAQDMPSIFTSSVFISLPPNTTPPMWGG